MTCALSGPPPTHEVSHSPPHPTLTHEEEAFLQPLGLFPNAKERSESLSVWAALSAHVLPLIEAETSPILLASIGDGVRPRTAALCAALASGLGARSPWRCVSVDPILSYDSASELVWLAPGGGARGDAALLASVAALRAALPHLACVRAPVQQVRITCAAGERVLLVLMHAHVSLEDAAASVEPPSALAAVVTCPCCDWEPRQRTLWGRVADVAYTDASMTSDKNAVRIWVRREGDAAACRAAAAAAATRAAQRAAPRAGRADGNACERNGRDAWTVIARDGPSAALLSTPACACEVVVPLLLNAASPVTRLAACLEGDSAGAHNLAPPTTWGFRALDTDAFAPVITRGALRAMPPCIPPSQRPLGGPLIALVARISRARRQRTQVFYSLAPLLGCGDNDAVKVVDSLWPLLARHSARESVTGRDREATTTPLEQRPRVIDLASSCGSALLHDSPVSLLQACVPRRGHDADTRLPPIASPNAALLEALVDGDAVLLIGVLGVLADCGSVPTRSRAPTPSLFVLDGALLYSAHWRVEGRRREA